MLSGGTVEPEATVLVIDDEYGARLQVELALTGSSQARLVAEATNGMRGCELAEELQPDIIVLDLSMPMMDGFEALPLIRTVAPGAAVLVRSNTDDADSVARAMSLGAVASIRKFLPVDELCDVIEAHVPPPARDSGPLLRFARRRMATHSMKRQR